MDKEINKRIVIYRKLANLNQIQVAELMGMKASTYSQMERSGSITTDRLLRLAEIFNVSVNDLLFDQQKQNVEPEPPKQIFPVPDPAPINKLHESIVDIFSNNINLDNLSIRDRNMIKMYINFKKSDQQKVCNLVEEIYHNNKKK